MNDSALEPAHYDFGSFALDLERGELRRGSTVVTLRPKSFAVLRYLVERRGRLVAKDELLDAVWGRRIVTDASVAKCLAEIRRALGDDAHTLVRTVHGRGYRFDAETFPTSRASPATPPLALPAAAVDHGGTAVAVPASSPTIAAAVAFPPARTSRSWRPVALALAAIVGVAVFAGARLASPTSGELAAVAGRSAPGGRGTVRRDCTRPDELAAAPACRDYLQARYYYQRRAPGDLERAERLYMSAVRLDPTHAPSWVGLAAIYISRSDLYGPGRIVELARAREALVNALALDPELPEAHARLGSYYAKTGDATRALASFERSLALGPDDGNTLAIAAGLALQLGQFERAVDLQQRAVAASPLSLVQQGNLAGYLLAAGRRAEAMQAMEAAIALSGRSTDELPIGVQLRLLQGRTEEARRAAARLPSGAERDSMLVLLDERSGQSADAAAALARLAAADSGEAAVVRAESLAWHGETAAAFRSLRVARERARAARTPLANANLAGRLVTSPYLARLRADPRWRAIAPDCGVEKSQGLAALVVRR